MSKLAVYLPGVAEAQIRSGADMSNWLGEVLKATEAERGPVDENTRKGLAAMRLKARDSRSPSEVTPLFKEVSQGVSVVGAPRTAAAIMTAATAWRADLPYLDPAAWASSAGGFSLPGGLQLPAGPGGLQGWALPAAALGGVGLILLLILALKKK